jgi:hypothetical protein
MTESERARHIEENYLHDKMMLAKYDKLVIINNNIPEDKQEIGKNTRELTGMIKSILRFKNGVG